MKKLLLSLFGIITLGLINFSSANTVGNLTSDSEICTVNFENTNYISVDDLFCGNGSRMYYCVSTNDYPFSIEFFYQGVNVFDSLVCFNFPFRDEDTDAYFFTDLDFSTDFNASGTLYVSSSPIKINSSCDYSEYESQIEYLSGNLALCESENLTLSGNLTTCEGELNSCMSGIGTGELQWSSLFINNIQHLGAPRINIMIPEEINWDYVVDSGSFDLDINGYNVDTEYIDGIIKTQNYKPTSEDFTKLVSMLAPYSKILIFCLFMFIIWAWIKKPFKSKKI